MNMHESFLPANLQLSPLGLPGEAHALGLPVQPTQERTALGLPVEQPAAPNVNAIHASAPSLNTPSFAPALPKAEAPTLKVSLEDVKASEARQEAAMLKEAARIAVNKYVGYDAEAALADSIAKVNADYETYLKEQEVEMGQRFRMQELVDADDTDNTSDKKAKKPVGVR